MRSIVNRFAFGDMATDSRLPTAIISTGSSFPVSRMSSYASFPLTSLTSPHFKSAARFPPLLARLFVLTSVSGFEIRSRQPSFSASGSDASLFLAPAPTGSRRDDVIGAVVDSRGRRLRRRKLSLSNMSSQRASRVQKFPFPGIDLSRGISKIQINTRANRNGDNATLWSPKLLSIYGLGNFAETDVSGNNVSSSFMQMCGQVSSPNLLTET